MRVAFIIIVAVSFIVGIVLTVRWWLRCRRDDAYVSWVAESMKKSGIEFDAAQFKANMKADMKAMRNRPRIDPPVYFSEDSVPTIEELCEVCNREGLPQIADMIEKQALPCFSLQPAGRDERKIEGPVSKVGGVPDLPGSEEWPKYNGNSLSFIAQINLAEVPRSAALEPLPAGGVLYFFYEVEQSTWGFDPKDKGSWRVLFCENISGDILSTAFPNDVPEHARYKEKALKAVEQHSIPDCLSLVDADGSLSKEQRHQVIEIIGQYEERLGSFHRLLGHPHQIQPSDMRLECQLASHGIYCGDASGFATPEAQALKEGVSDWRLLLQVESDDSAGMMWGDAGMLYFWIREEDLAARRFENVWMILECG